MTLWTLKLTTFNLQVMSCEKDSLQLAVHCIGLLGVHSSPYLSAFSPVRFHVLLRSRLFAGRPTGNPASNSILSPNAVWARKTQVARCIFWIGIVSPLHIVAILPKPGHLGQSGTFNGFNRSISPIRYEVKRNKTDLTQSCLSLHLKHF